MSYSIQRFNNYIKDERAAIVVEGREVTIGSAEAADLQLLLTSGMPNVCLKVWSEGGVLLAENRMREPGQIFLLEEELSGIVKLDHNDLLRIGNDYFKVLLTSEIPQAEKEVFVEPIVEPTISRALASTVLNSAMTRHTPADSEWSEASFLEHLCEEHSAFFFANFRHAGRPEPDQQLVGDDLFKDAPGEAREIYSLHALTKPATEEKIKLYEELRELDAAIWVVPEIDSETSLQDAKIHLAWFARPSVMEMALKNSPDIFCESLLKSFKAIILKSGSSTRPWALYSKADFDPIELGISDGVAAHES